MHFLIIRSCLLFALDSWFYFEICELAGSSALNFRVVFACFMKYLFIRKCLAGWRCGSFQSDVLLRIDFIEYLYLLRFFVFDQFKRIQMVLNI